MCKMPRATTSMSCCTSSRPISTWKTRRWTARRASAAQPTTKNGRARSGKNMNGSPTRSPPVPRRSWTLPPPPSPRRSSRSRRKRSSISRASCWRRIRNCTSSSRSTTAWTPQAGPLVRSRRYRSQRRGDAEGCTTVRGKSDGHNDLREGSRTPCAVNWAKLKYIVVPAEAGIQAKAARHARGGLDSGVRRSDKGGGSHHRERHPEKSVDCKLPGPKDMVVPGEAGIQARTRRAMRADAYRGRGAVSLPPALRTVRAVLPHTALRSVVIYIEIGAQERELAIGLIARAPQSKRSSLPPLPPVQGRQHPLTPDRCFHPRPSVGHSLAAWGF